MIPIWLIKFAGNRIYKAIKHSKELKKIDKYVNKPNELDKEIKIVKKDIAMLKKNSHPQADWICMKCGCTGKRVKKKTKIFNK